MATTPVTVCLAGNDLPELLSKRAVLGKVPRLLTLVTLSGKGCICRLNGGSSGSVPISVQECKVGISEGDVLLHYKLCAKAVVGREGIDSGE
jgi:hypothetical protein